MHMRQERDLDNSEDETTPSIDTIAVYLVNTLMVHL